MTPHKRSTRPRATAQPGHDSLVRAMQRIGVNSARADRLSFELAELLEASNALRKHIETLSAALQTEGDSRPLWKAACDLLGEFEHVRYHIKGAAPTIRQLREAARTMPPLKDLSDEELSVQTIDAARATFRKASTHGRANRAHDR